KTRKSAKGADRGVDIVASPDGLGLEQPRIRAEVKHREGSIGASDLRSFIGGLRPSDRGLFVSTGGFSKEARYEAERSTIPVSLIDIDELTNLLIENYDNLDNDTKALVPLVKLYWPA
ncbi:restriction endonuclease, partial [candidate division WOR-3 bacterium]|nr:restriction endonuclease [candidate division WOR-3 bacterium]